MDEMNFRNNLKKIYQFGEKLAYFEKNEEFFLTEIQNIDKEFLEKQKEIYLEGSVDKNKLRPVNFVRYVLLDKILRNEKVEIKFLEEVINNLEKNQSQFFKDFPEFKQLIEKQEEKDSFKNWNYFRILFQIYYNYASLDIEAHLKYLANEIEKEIIKMKLKRKISSFDGNNYYGRSHCWIALYPLTKKNHQYAVQFFLKINPSEGNITFGLASGKYDKGENVFRIKSLPNFDLHEFISFLSALKGEFIERNNLIVVGNGEETEKPPLNLILYGPPGTGKTILAIRKAVKIVDPSTETEDFKKIMKKYKEFIDRKLISFITFHQSYSYEDFIEGYRYNEEKEIPIPESGILRKFIDNISDDSLKYVLIIDEINRGNISNIFGEAITIIEEDKRIGGKFETKVDLPYSHEKFGLPANLFIIGTMNTADRSIALLDTALRRRFQFEEILPNKKIVEDTIKEHFENANDWKSIVDIFDLLNKRIETLLDKDHTIGHSFFMNIKNIDDLYNVWYSQIIPLLKEYFYNDWSSIRRILGEYKETGGNYKGFVKDLRKRYRNIFPDYSVDEYPCEIVRYDDRKDEFLEILRKTFLET